MKQQLWLDGRDMSNTPPPYQMQADDGIPVTLPSGAQYYVLTTAEEQYLQDKIRRYLEDNHFVNISDMLEIDRMVTFELLIHRWTLWLAKNKDYWNDPINADKLSATCSEYSREVRQIKKGLGVDKLARDKTRGDDSVAALWDNLRTRAREFGYARNEQFVAVLTAFHRIKASIVFYENCDEVERKENACELTDVLRVVKEEIEKFDQIDEDFRFKKQRLWVRNQ